MHKSGPNINPIKVVVFLNGNESYGLQQVLLVHYREAPEYNLELSYICLEKGDTYKKLAAVGADVTVIGGKLPHAYPRNVFKLAAVIKSHSKEIATIYRNLKDVLEQTKPDIFYTHNITEHVIGGLAAKACGVKAVGHSHLMLNPRRNFGLSRKGVSFILNRSLDMMIPVSYAARDSLWAGLKRKAYPIYVGRDIQDVCTTAMRLKENSEIPSADIVYVGRLTPIKKQDILVDAVAILVQKGINIRALLVSGEADERNSYYVQLQKQIIALGIQENVVFTGFVPEPYGILAKAKASILCCEKEGCPNLVIESMACRTPIVVPNAGGAGELVEDGVTGLKYVPDDSTSLAQCIDKLLHDADLRTRLTENGFKHANATFTFQEHMRQLRHRFEQVLST